MEPVKVAVRKQGKKSKRPDKRAARQRYWLSRHLAKRKIEALMRNNGLTRFQAGQYWEAVRGGRRTKIAVSSPPLSPIEQNKIYKKLVA